jgi:hypothetical protein
MSVPAVRAWQVEVGCGRVQVPPRRTWTQTPTDGAGARGAVEREVWAAMGTAAGGAVEIDVDVWSIAEAGARVGVGRDGRGEGALRSKRGGGGADDGDDDERRRRRRGVTVAVRGHGRCRFRP